MENFLAEKIIQKDINSPLKKKYNYALANFRIVNTLTPLITVLTNTTKLQFILLLIAPII